MDIISGRPEIVVGLVDGPVALNHPDLAANGAREIPGRLGGKCAQASSAACVHGTFVAGILFAKRGSPAPAICPDCTLLVRPIFGEAIAATEQVPSAKPAELAAAIAETVDAGARVVNLSLALAQLTLEDDCGLIQALDYASRRDVIVVAASGNQGTVGSSTVTRHPSVVPVVACDLHGKPLGQSNLGHTIGWRGLMAPGERITSLGVEGRPRTFGGTSAAAPFVTGAIALLWSRFPRAKAVEIRLAVMQANRTRRTTVVPPLLDAWAAHQLMTSRYLGGQ